MGEVGGCVWRGRRETWVRNGISGEGSSDVSVAGEGWVVRTGIPR